jgi:hypothetical protein
VTVPEPERGWLVSVNDETNDARYENTEDTDPTRFDVLTRACKPKEEPAELLQMINESECQEELWQALSPTASLCEYVFAPNCKELRTTSALPETAEVNEMNKITGEL